jgi:hypothetical protein
MSFDERLELVMEAINSNIVFSGAGVISAPVSSWWSRSLATAVAYADNRANAIGTDLGDAGGKPYVLVAKLDRYSSWEPDPDEWDYPGSESEGIRWRLLSNVERRGWFDRLSNFHVFSPMRVLSMWLLPAGLAQAPDLRGVAGIAWLRDHAKLVS